MSPVLLASLLNQLPFALGTIAKIMQEIREGKEKTEVTPEDIMELDRLSKQHAADIYARHGATLPPPAK